MSLSDKLNFSIESLAEKFKSGKNQTYTVDNDEEALLHSFVFENERWFPGGWKDAPNRQL